MATRLFQTNIFQGGGVDPDASKLTAIMDGLDDLLSTVVLNHYAFPVEDITVPCTVVSGPTRIDFDQTMGRGSDLFVVPVYFVVGKTGTKDSWSRISAVLANSPGIKDAVDGTHDFGDVRATNAAIAEFTIGGVTYLAAQFDCEVIG